MHEAGAAAKLPDQLFVPCLSPILALSGHQLRTMSAVASRDLTGLHTCFGDHRAMRFWNFPASLTEADSKKIFAWLGKTSSPYDHLAWTVADKLNDHCIGMVNYNQRELRNRRLEIGYIIAPEHQRKGFGTEAVQTMIEYCTSEIGAHRIGALIHPDNAASLRLVERLGFRCEGELMDYWRVGDKYVSAMMYAFIFRDKSKATEVAKSRRRK